MVNKRVLVVDDSCLYQRLISDVISEREGLEVVGVASNGQIALNMMNELRPDLVTLDILMAEMDGFQTLFELRKLWPSVITIMISSLTSEGSDAALDALALGASEHAAKPSSGKGIDKIRAELSSDLLPKIEALCGLDVQRLTKTPNRLPKTVIAKTANAVFETRVGRNSMIPIAQAIELVAIGVSTGGPDALGKVLSELPEDIGVPIVIVQHMPAQFTAKLAGRLNASSRLEVVEAKKGDKLRAGTVYIAPGNYHMVLDDMGTEVIINLNRDEPENSCRPSVDPLFRSIPPIYRDKCLGVIMTGMGCDGLHGCEALTEAGCPVIVQDERTSVVWGMPKLVAMAGLAREQVPLDRMAEVISSMVKVNAMLKNLSAANSDTYNQTIKTGGRS